MAHASWCGPMSVLCEPCEEREPKTYKSTQCAKSLNIDVDNFQTYVRCTSCDCFGIEGSRQRRVRRGSARRARLRARRLGVAPPCSLASTARRVEAHGQSGTKLQSPYDPRSEWVRSDHHSNSSSSSSSNSSSTSTSTSTSTSGHTSGTSTIAPASAPASAAAQCRTWHRQRQRGKAPRQDDDDDDDETPR